LIAYFDTSALVPLLIEEPGSVVARRVWDEALGIVSITLLYAEARAALAQAHRMGRITRLELRAAVEGLDDLYSQISTVSIDELLVRQAGELAEAHGLRGYDAVHLAAAQRAADSDFVVVAGDQALLRAAEAVGLSIAPAA